MPTATRPPLPPGVTPAGLLRVIAKLRADGQHEKADFLLSYLPPADPFAHLDAPPQPPPPNGAPDAPPAPTANQGGLAISGPPKPANGAGEGSLPPKIDKADSPAREVSCVYLPLPEPMRSRVLALGKMVPDADAVEREDKPHATAFFGLHDADPTSCFEVLSHFRPVRLTFGKASVFHRPEYDVVKIDVESDQLRRMNAELRNLPHTSEFRNFVPHVTVAYVAPGKGPYYADLINGVSAMPDSECVCPAAVFSDHEGTKYVYPLGRKLPVGKSMSYLSDGAGGALVAPAASGKPIRLRRNRKIRRVLKDALAEILPAGGSFPLTALDPEDFVFGKAFDPAAHPREKASHDDKKPGEFATKGGKRSGPKLSDDQREALRALAEHFPDGIAHLLDERGRVPREHYESDEEIKARQEIPKERAAHAEAGRAIDRLHEDNDRTRRLIQDDLEAGDEIRDLPHSDWWAGKLDQYGGGHDYSDSARTLNDEHLNALDDAHADLDPDPGYPDEGGPQAGDYSEHEDFPDEGDYESPSDWYDDASAVRNGRERESDDFTNASDEWAKSAAETSGEWRRGQIDALSKVVGHARKALGHPPEDWAELYGDEAPAQKSAVEDLQRKAAAVLDRLRPAPDVPSTGVPTGV